MHRAVLAWRRLGEKVGRHAAPALQKNNTSKTANFGRRPSWLAPAPRRHAASVRHASPDTHISQLTTLQSGRAVSRTACRTELGTRKKTKGRGRERWCPPVHVRPCCWGFCGHAPAPGPRIRSWGGSHRVEGAWNGLGKGWQPRSPHQQPLRLTARTPSAGTRPRPPARGPGRCRRPWFVGCGEGKRKVARGRRRGCGAVQRLRRRAVAASLSAAGRRPECSRSAGVTRSGVEPRRLVACGAAGRAARPRGKRVSGKRKQQNAISLSERRMKAKKKTHTAISLREKLPPFSLFLDAPRDTRHAHRSSSF